MDQGDRLEDIMHRIALVIIAAMATFSLGPVTSAQAPDPKTGPVIEDVWQPARTPRGGVSWKVLEATEEITRLDDEGYILSRPRFTKQVRALAGKRIKVAGWMMPLDAQRTQKRFVLLGYPPGCPFHFHAAPNQFVEVIASTPFPTDERKVFVVSGVLELTGYDESGIFYRLRDARPGLL
ncbi:DUF3299 domain-containing protein [Erythrobacter sp.]|jgi:hypothetical protein|uniref:DUF3299 domain-containing protein n=1 Tax=Erythrobacter sp. TaxID=1042 RepID=UPI002EB1000C|nr:DUF3299 domain-containing protein [Erythrobacter sp.]